jgi:hypothetical protein
MTLGELYDAIGVDPSDKGRVGKVWHELFSLQERGWAGFIGLEDGSGGEVWITPQGAEVIQDTHKTVAPGPKPGIPGNRTPKTAQDSPPPSRKPRSKRSSAAQWRWPIMISVLNLVAGVSVNLVAALVMREGPENVFTLLRIAAIVLLAAVGLIAGTLIQRQPSLSAKWGGAITVGLVVLTALVVIFLPGKPPDDGSPFLYAVRVQAGDTAEDIPNAEVEVDIGNGKAPLRDITDADGYVRIPVDASYAGKRAIIIVQAGGYEKYRGDIDLTADGLPLVVPLERLP